METLLNDWRSHELSSREKLVMIDSASKHLGAWLQSIPKMHTSAFYKWIKDKLNAFNDAYILLWKLVE